MDHEARLRKLDEKLAAALALVLAQEQERFTKQLRDATANMDAIPPGYWDSFEAIVAQALAADLEQAYLLSAREQAAQEKFKLDEASLILAAHAWATEHAAAAASSFIENSRKWIEEALADAKAEHLAAVAQGKQKADQAAALAAFLLLSISEQLDFVFGKTRAEGMAATLVTKGNTDAGRAMIDEIQVSTGLQYRGYWHAERTACDICAALHGSGPDVWAISTPDGPPKHPNCRCYLKYRRVF